MPDGSPVMPDRWYDDYERGRPGWPPEVVSVAGLPRAATVLELGAGTGKLTRLLVSAFERVVPVEPDEGMRRLFAEVGPDVQLLPGSAEQIPAPDDSVDAAFAAESFHKYDGERALGEIARVLRPRGALIVMWNLPLEHTDAALEAVDRLVRDRVPKGLELGHEPADLSSKRYTSGEWRLPFASAPFEELQEARFANPQTLDREGALAFAASMGWIAELPDAERLSLLDEVRSLLVADEYRRVWETRVHWARLVGG